MAVPRFSGHNMKKIIAKSLVVLALLPLTAQAILPLIVGGLVMATNSASLTTALVGSAAVVGAAVAFIGMGGDPATTPPANSPILVKINPAEPMPTPSGWTPPVSPSTEPTAPNTAQNTGDPGVPPYSGSTINQTTGCALMAQNTVVKQGGTYWLRETGSATPTSPTAGAGGWVFQNNCVAGQGGGTLWFAQVPTCGTGYTPSGGSCVATTGSVSKPGDGKCTIVRTGSTFSGDPMDPDCSVSNVPVTVTISGSEVTVKPSNTETQTVKTNPDGSTTSTRTTINTTNNTTTTETVNINNGGGVGNSKITGIGTTTVNGTGDQAGTTPIPKLDIPTDYNREPTQQAIKANLDQIKAGQCGGPSQPKCGIDESGTATEGNFTQATSDLDAASLQRQGQVAGVAAGDRVTSIGADWSFTGLLPSCGCAPLSFTFHGWTGGADWCPLFGETRTLFAWFYGLLGALYVWRRSTSVNGGK